MDAPKITLVRADDWEGVYFDGELVHQHHSIDVEDILQLLDIKVDRVHPDQNWLDRRGSLPKRLRDVKRRQR